MKIRNVYLIATISGLMCAFVARAQNMHHPGNDGSEQLGEVNFTVSCSAASQKQFNRATALLHSFWYSEAEKAYSAITMDEPTCVMAQWGVAISLYHPVWAPATTTELQKGWAAVEKAKSLPAKTDRERDYIAAIETFFSDSGKLDHRTRTLAYEKSMERVYLSYPKDQEVAIFYALALLGTALNTDKTYANQKKAANILNKILPEAPNHPGVVHYLIHSFDYPQLAELALPAARWYAKVAPSSPHALHMPSHIFTRLGLWQESIQSNLASAAAAKNFVAKTRPDAGSFDQLHALDYLVYAYLQGAEDRKAKEILDQANALNKVDSEVVAAAYAFAAIPPRYALERRQWSDAAKLKIHPITFPWYQFRYAEAITYFARAVGAARSGNPAAARKDIEKLASIQKALAEANNIYWATQVEIERRSAAAWLAHAEKKNEEGLKLMISAADLEDSTEKHPVTPGPIIPARELLGDMLIELNQPAQALREFEVSLRNSPNRFNALFGAARAAELSGDRQKARTYYANIVTLCEHADDIRPELRKARKFLAKK